MARDSASDFREKLSDVTECSICAEIFTNPKLLPCVHTFCLHCLEKYGNDRKPGDQMPCPICRSEFVIPQNGFSNLPNNFFIGKIVEIGKLATASSKESICELCCEETAFAKKFCIDCEQKLCDRCNHYHGRIKNCQNHQVVELGSQIDVKNVNVFSSYCEHHPKELIKMYCYEDNVAICLICCVESHQTHRCSNVDKAAGQFIDQLKKNTKKVDDRHPECQETYEKLEKFKTEFMDVVTKTEESIHSSGLQMKKLVDQHTDMLLQDLRVATERNLKSFENTKQEFDRFRVMIDSYKRYCDELLSRGSSVDICRAANQMHKRADDLEQLLSNSSVYKFSCDKIGFQSANVEDHMKQGGINNIVGELKVEKSADWILQIRKSVSDYSMKVSQLMKGERSTKTTYQKSAKGPVAIYECDGKYVALENSGRKDEALGGWSLTRNIDGKDSATYKLPESCGLRAGQKMKVWAKGTKPFTGAIGDIESDQKWGVGALIITKLVNPLGEDRATHIEQTTYN